MNDEERFAFESNMFQQMPSSHPSFSTALPSTNDQDELIARRKLEQKRRFQQKQGNATADVDSFMKTMFTDLKLQTKTTTHNSAVFEARKTPVQIFDIPSSFPNHQSSTTQTTTVVSGAADWSKIAFDDDYKTIFHQEEKAAHIPTANTDPPSTLIEHSTEQQQQQSPSSYPSWCLQPITFLPLVYQQVFEASYQSNLIQTSVLYPILLLSGLRQDQLSQIWSQVNLTQPGTLIKEELFMALALIALAQNSNGIIYPNDQLYHLTDIPIPHFHIQQEQPPPTPAPTSVSSPDPSPSPVAPEPELLSIPLPESTSLPSTSAPVYHQEDFADFTSFDQIEDNTDLTNSSTTVTTTSIPVNSANTINNGDSLLLDFDDNHLYPPETKTDPSETQSIASLDLPVPTVNLSNTDNLSQKGISDSLSFTSSNNNEFLPVPDAQSVHSTTSSSEPSKLELTQFSFFSDEASELDSHTSIWLRCFEKCHAIFSQANETFSSIGSPALCTEVLQQTRTRDYIHQLQEIFHVHKRIYTAATLEPTTANEINSLWKQIVVLWTNLQSFFSTAHLHLLNDDDIDYSSLLSADPSSYCSICLLSTNGLDAVLPSASVFSLNTACLTFASRSYHAPCANFYLNLIDGILPSLRRSS